MTVRIRSGGDPETTTCRWCEQVSTCHHVGRMFCPSYKECSRLYNYSIKCMFDIRKKDRLFVSYSISPLKRNNKYEANVMMFREYIWYHVRPDLEKLKEPLLQYKQWELYLRTNPMPKVIKSLMIKLEPLPRELPTPIKIENPENPKEKIWAFKSMREIVA